MFHLGFHICNSACHSSLLPLAVTLFSSFTHFFHFDLSWISTGAVWIYTPLNIKNCCFVGALGNFLLLCSSYMCYMHVVNVRQLWLCQCRKCMSTAGWQGPLSCSFIVLLGDLCNRTHAFRKTRARKELQRTAGLSSTPTQSVMLNRCSS